MKSNSSGSRMFRDEVGHHHERALEDPDQEQVAPGVVGGDPLAQLASLSWISLVGDQDRSMSRS